MSEKRSGDPRKRAAAEQGVEKQGRSNRELSTAFIFVAWIVFFAIWLAAGSLLVAALVFGVILSGAIALLSARS
jgi:hypothetical protein